MSTTSRPQRSRAGPVWQTLFNNTYPHFGDRRRRASQRAPPAGGQNLEVPQVQNVEPPAEHVEPEIAARAPSPDPATGQNAPEAIQQPAPQGRRRRQNVPRAEQRPPPNDNMPQGHDEPGNLQRPNPDERLNRTNNLGGPRRQSRDNNGGEPDVEPLFVLRPNNRAEPNVEPLFVRRPNNRAEPNVEPLVVAPPNRQGHGEARHRRENPGPMHQRWARDIENSQGRGNSRSDARIIVANTQVRPVVVDWELANAYWEASSTTSAIDDSREPQTYTGDSEEERFFSQATYCERRRQRELMKFTTLQVSRMPPETPALHGSL